MLRLIGVLVALGCGGLLAAAGQSVSHRLALHSARGAASDLEIAGDVPGVPRGESRFVTRRSLLSLPQVSVHLEKFEDFPELVRPGVIVTGVYLDALAARIGAPLRSASAVEAICQDGYAAAYPVGYLWIHRPLFVLAIDGLSPRDWAAKYHTYDAGPYFVAYEHFTPHFRVLAHDDRPLEPDQITKLFFSTKSVVFRGIEPRESRDPALHNSPIVSGFRIARQNCFRCHNSGSFGGSQSGLSWKKLEKIARERPDYFSQWIYDPQTLDPKSKMPANREYDKATLDALTKYFAALGTEGN
jgi:hypothetical protein